ncbi:large ribosomal subunit protein uL30m-like [Ornithodoros turicata]|uniref:large ribosomal subunit protein uL30m-like n=1 Tax=Ornithodoros turicata TaxID=34597 RepID=UPI003138B3DE
MAVSLLRKNLTSIIQRTSTSFCVALQSHGALGCRRFDTFSEQADSIFEKVRETRRKAETGDFEVPKLFLVERIASEYGVPHYEKDILKILQLLPSKEDKKNRIRRPVGSRTVVKNTPFMCKMLWRVKHLIRVSPITFPDGEPTLEHCGYTHLDRDGMFRIIPKLQVDQNRLLNPPEYEKTKLEGEHIRKVLHRKWMNSL